MPDEVIKAAEAAPKAPPAAPVADNQEELVVGSSRGAVIDSWFRDSFVGTALGATTELYNAGYAAKEDLKKRLAA